MSKYQSVSPETVARALAAIGSPVRLRLLLELASCCVPGGACDAKGDACCVPADSEESCVGRIAEAVHVAPSTVSHHIKELRDAGVIWCLKQGRRVCCGIDSETLAAVRAVVEQLHAVSEPRPAVRLVGTEGATAQVGKRAGSGERTENTTRIRTGQRAIDRRGGTRKARSGSK